MTERKDKSDELFPAGAEGAGLDSFFAAARAEAPQPDGGFLARIEAQALAEQPVARGGAPAVARPRPTGVLRQLREALGGWAGMAGLATACAAGIWIGVSPPDGLTVLWGGDAAALGTIGVDPLSSFDLALMEG
ncbi:hypothetical protein [Antarctobacter heliothermus]|nr:hypothetical protein [Antarctobacter heliothermus]